MGAGRMRLVCPNCDAQYEVSDDAIPAEGRDVQCSNCGHAWFQMSPDVEAAIADEENLFDAPEDLTEPEAITPAPQAAEASAPQPTDADVKADTPPAKGDAAIPGDASSDMRAPSAPQRRSLDESVVAVLREEAERGAAVRQAEAPRPLETQTDLGLAAPAAGRRASQLVAQLKGESPEEPFAAPEPARAAKGRDLLPDIEEINSTLRASSDRAGDGVTGDDLPDLTTQGRNGFRSGFLLMVLLAVGLMLAYVMAPKIIEQIPGSADAMASYVSAVDTVRVWLDEQIQNATSGLKGDGG